MKYRAKLIWMPILALGLMLALYNTRPLPCLAQCQPSQGPSGTLASGQKVSIDFNDVDIHLFIKFISEITGKNFIVDQRVKGKVTISWTTNGTKPRPR